MGTILASAMITGVRAMVADPDADWFSDADWLRMLNQAERYILLLRPELHASREEFTVAEGIAQVLPAEATALLDIYTNVASGRRARQCSRALLENLNDFWPAGTAAVDVKHWTADPRSKLRFDVFPPNDGTGEINILMGTVPAALTATSQAIHLNDTYETPLQYLMLAYAYAVNTEKQDLTKSTSYESRAGSILGVNAQTTAALAPKTAQPGGG